MAQTASPLQVNMYPFGSAFWKIFTASATANLGDGLIKTALPLIALQITTQPVLVASVTTANTLPWLLVSLYVGTLVDRWDRKQMVLYANLLRVIGLSILAILIALNITSIALLCGIAFLLGMGETVVDTSTQTLLPMAVKRSHLDSANTHQQRAEVFTNELVGPPFGGLLVGISAVLATVVSAGAYLIAVLALGTLRHSFQPPQSRASVHAAIIEGLQHVQGHPILRILVLSWAMFAMARAGWLAVLALYVVAPGPMALSTATYGLLLIAPAIGGIVGASCMAWLQRHMGRRAVLRLNVIGAALMVGAPALTADLWVMGMLMFFGGVTGTMWSISLAVLRQQLVPSALLGRVTASMRLAGWGAMPLGAAVAGVIGSLFGISLVFILAGTTCVLVGIVLYRLPPLAHELH